MLDCTKFHFGVKDLYYKGAYKTPISCNRSIVNSYISFIKNHWLRMVSNSYSFHEDKKILQKFIKLVNIWQLLLSKIDFEIQSVYPKGDQSWVFIGRTDAEAETPILRPPDEKSWIIVKDPDAGRDWGQEEKGTTEDEMAGWNHRLDGHEFE